MTTRTCRKCGTAYKYGVSFGSWHNEDYCKPCWTTGGMSQQAVQIAQAEQSVGSNTTPDPGIVGRYSFDGSEFVVTYFEADVGLGASGHEVAVRFGQFLEKMARAGYELARVDTVPYRMSPGCLLSLFGFSERYGQCTVVTFRVPSAHAAR